MSEHDVRNRPQSAKVLADVLYYELARLLLCVRALS